MEDVDGFNNEKFRLREKTSVHYAMTLIVDNYLVSLQYYHYYFFATCLM